MPPYLGNHLGNRRGNRCNIPSTPHMPGMAKVKSNAADIRDAAGAGDEAKVRRQFWRKLRRVFARIPFAVDLMAAYFCALDPRTPTSAKATLLGALAYFIMPVDLVPDFVALLGFTDDAAVLFMALRQVRRHMRPEHREQARVQLKRLRDGDSEGP